MNATMAASAGGSSSGTLPILIGLFISQEIESSTIVLHHLHGHYEPLQYGMGDQPFHIAVTPTLFSRIFTFLWVFSHTWDECIVKCSIIFKLNLKLSYQNAFWLSLHDNM
jgi:hypothetical protein